MTNLSYICNICSYQHGNAFWVKLPKEFLEDLLLFISYFKKYFILILFYSANFSLF